MVRVTVRALGFFSLVLGAVQLIAPRRLLAAIGIAPTGAATAVTRLIGLRELSGVPGLLVVTAPVGWLAARVAGDVMDFALLRRAQGKSYNVPERVGAAAAAVAAISAVDLLATVAARRDQKRRSRHPDRIVRTVTVNRPVDELYRFWRNLENLPRVMPHLESVEVRGDQTSHWVARAPFGSRAEWDAEIVHERPDEYIAWRSLEGSGLQNEGSVQFQPAPRGRGTEVRVEMAYEAPGGALGALVALVSGEEPRHQVSDALRRFKQIMETGEPIVSDATIGDRKLRQREAQPARSERREAPVPVGAAGDVS